MKKILFSVFIAAFVAAIFLSMIACGANKGNPDAGSQSALRPPTNVKVMALKPESLTERIFLTGATEPFMEVRVSSEEGGLVEKLSFDKGYSIRKEQELIRINASLIQASLDEAKADLALRESNYRKAEQLFERKSITAQDRLATKTLYEMALARYEQAKIRLDKAIIESPITGIIIEKNVEEGEFVAPGGSIAVIQDLSRIKVSAALPESEITYIRKGSPAVITLDAFPGETFEGKISYLGNSASSSTRTFPIEIVINNADIRIGSGMVARLSIVKRELKDAVVVPEDSLVQTETGKIAFVLNGTRASRRDVKTGASSDNRCVVEAGLNFGDTLIVTGQRDLVDGQEVKVLED